MRFIDNLPLKCPSGWQAKSDAAMKEVSGGKPVDGFAQVWKDLKDGLAGLSQDKCWYCEMPQKRSDNAVDHFRPKSLYPWGAFDKENFRYSCTFCNSYRKNPETGETSGKGNKFPLIDETVRATCRAEEAREKPVLLDPCEARDPNLLSFDVDGKPVPRYANGINHSRALQSIKIYHLDHPALIDDRKILAIEIDREVSVADELFPELETGGTKIERAFNSSIKKIKRMISPEAKLSSFAKNILRGHRNKEWVEWLLE